MPPEAPTTRMHAPESDLLVRLGSSDNDQRDVPASALTP